MVDNSSGRVLKSLRKEKKLSQKKLADLAGISQSTLVKYEKGSRKIPKDVDNTLSKILNIETLIKDEEDKIEILIGKLIAYRDMNKLLNKELADNIGISEVLLSYVLNRKRNPSKEMQKKIDIFLLSNEKEILKEINRDSEIFSLSKDDKIVMGKRIREVRKNREETLEKFGKNFTIYTGKNVISRWEKGINIPDIEKLMNIAYLGKVTVPYLMYGEDYKNILPKDERVSDFKKINSFSMGLRMRKIRKDYYLEREEFGKLFSPSISKWSIDRYENGRDIPNTNRIIQYAYIGNLSLEFLIYGI
ncbi:TPA: helix-turn-helix domain-containing protein [Enterococcus faecium]|jgi:transcriptional regulator with XRE-family HTH domain|uniref:Helix-turn-helix domain-containing protein n=29 Tax=Enterococcus TaxID=1350 RepID=A0AAE4KYA5_ENTGA|nr:MULTISPECIES: helix-turn-helix domain-containing protein [Enterococcus]HAQ1347532.1 helix-turn-helix domain-containing protein [Enterococcus faecium Ef_RPH1]HAQ1379901.1 helix-turn-helix domain-containing protein [Enterococcus faecium Ef_aus0091]HAQ1391836.1 helix-turn-helix domain-containing protein [Enterococcus faecium Ef_aus0040]HEO8218392.1 helix-turn-helix domain-containing protein [Streptococcus agalactiae]ALZ51799.1 Cro/Cl family transcriptional regulator [Enterococcus faecium]